MAANPNHLTISHADLLAVERELCKRSFVDFVKLAWPILEPAQPYVHGWHIDAVAEHLVAITDDQLNRLLINIPPGTMKSMLVNVFWPAWEWGPRNLPAYRYIGASHEEGLATRDTMKMRRLITSEWYQERWPLVLTGDQNAKTFFENVRTGFRISCPVKSMTGRRGDRVMWDDPHSVEAAISDAHRETALRVFDETLPTRLNNPDRSAIVIVMQRLHEQDVAGHLLEKELGYEHLMLPMEFEADHPHRKFVWQDTKTAEKADVEQTQYLNACVKDGKDVGDWQKEYLPTVVGFSDPRTKEGELLFPERFPLEVVERDKKVMGTYAVAGQFQQRPGPRTGGFFAWEELKIVPVAPRLVKIVRYWDKAGTKDGGAYTAGVKMGVCADGQYYVLDVVRDQWEAPQRERAMKQTAELDGTAVDIWTEQEPGSGGKESAQATVRNLAGFKIRTQRATGDKAVRAEPYSVQVEAGNVFLVKGAWNQAFIDEHKTFPRSGFKDQIDAASGAFNKLARPQPRPGVRSL
jgi:predicted phage terminase large subunit-like protein